MGRCLFGVFTGCSNSCGFFLDGPCGVINFFAEALNVASHVAQRPISKVLRHHYAGDQKADHDPDSSHHNSMLAVLIGASA
jgi:hypothetical protein